MHGPFLFAYLSSHAYDVFTVVRLTVVALSSGSAIGSAGSTVDTSTTFPFPLGLAAVADSEDFFLTTLGLAGVRRVATVEQVVWCVS